MAEMRELCKVREWGTGKEGNEQVNHRVGIMDRGLLLINSYLLQWEVAGQ